jgi:hypothetical protein
MCNVYCKRIVQQILLLSVYIVITVNMLYITVYLFQLKFPVLKLRFFAVSPKPHTFRMQIDILACSSQEEIYIIKCRGVPSTHFLRCNYVIISEHTTFMCQ